MGTKVTVFGQDEPKKELKKIEFVKILTTAGELEDAMAKPSGYDNIECTDKGFGKYDIFNAWNEGFNSKLTFLGHFNDGVV